jgi:hypothetical protein
MNNATIQIKIQQRLNKLASSDYDNIECWQIVEAFNKGQVAWCRRQLHGMNQKQEGDEASKRRIDDLQILLTESDLVFNNEDLYDETPLLPENYFEWKRLSVDAKDECCKDTRKMVVYLAEQANLDQLLRDKNKKPDFSWGETFCTLQNNSVRVYTNNEFTVETATLTFYRQPRLIQITGCTDPYTQVLSVVDVESEFKDDIVELLIDETAKILAGDIESFNQQQIAEKEVEGNN